MSADAQGGIGLALVLAVACPGVAAAGSLSARTERYGEAVWYGRVAFFATKRIMRIPAGGLFSSQKPDCGLSRPKPV